MDELKLIRIDTRALLLLPLGGILGGVLCIVLLFFGVAGNFYETTMVIIPLFAFGGFLIGVVLSTTRPEKPKKAAILKGILILFLVGGLVPYASSGLRHPTAQGLYVIGVGLSAVAIVLIGFDRRRRAAHVILCAVMALFAAAAFAATHSYAMLAYTLIGIAACFAAWFAKPPERLHRAPEN